MPLRFAVVCSSNMNRSMEAHAFLSKKSFTVQSFGTGDKVKLPGSAPNKPNIYDFGTTYEHIYRDLQEKDRSLYTQNGLLHMLDRNRRIKPGPQRLQECSDKFDVVISCEERVYDQILEMFESREPVDNTPVHVINIDIQDNHEEATIGAFLICDLCTQLEDSQDLEDDIDELLQEFESKAKRQVLHCVQFY
ncbi:RNA polymerase II subunit A C-terminal domain phosphatase SSU72-like [Amphibalanus amphitrite]|uniref:RNA polymerase II subunit A C-terminal domain phosphatase SSU72-like n=1 Tax=Amphibalanus amphitrite TaxID=1232801 RepID=UPI001C925D94|nr:RNA polymerase II subunit A C-terminal domain phosphatase SSU72-like [Amphibalanus amphitrite]XP_043205629.1 RNA polymerase II subunit A C-terminal domain phosphatase SSU72-like [Amphibalanus amphitrite]XP_043214478.1 RNA polymerase II subunit A C-terminal domain phosphatase SSU72-like [Amphibalanus amphitrite]XP_043214479.1 RNA polymerase II subunit A C-terminal domain phosphatase SSU72-like [Amphibalanus amphitrite]XP_043214480.1 RNA polymerase II subunit A C-terminal domain phosphatase SS